MGLAVIGGLKVDTCASEVLNIVLKRNEKYAVVRDRLRTELLAKLSGPFGGLVGPITLPFLVPVRIAQLQQLDSLATMLKGVTREQAVRVTADNSKAALLRASVLIQACFVRATRHNVVSLVCIFYQRPERLQVPHVVVIVLHARRACHMRQRRNGTSFADHAVSAVQLGPSFLDQHGPNFAAIRRISESRQSVRWITGDILVDYDFLPSPIDVEVDRVDASRVDFLRVEEALDPALDLGQRSKARHKVTVS